MGWLKKLLLGGGSSTQEDVTAAPTPVKGR